MGLRDSDRAAFVRLDPVQLELQALAVKEQRQQLRKTKLLFDHEATRSLGSRILRGTGDVRVVALVTVTVAWLITPPLTVLLGVQLGWGAIGGWLGLCVEVLFGGSYLNWRLYSGGWHAAAAEARERLEAERVNDDEAHAKARVQLRAS